MNDFEKLFEMLLKGENKKSPAMSAAKEIHDLYEAYISVGFNEDKAFELVKIMLSGGLAK